MRAQEYWRFLTELAGPVSAVLEGLAREEREEVRAALEEEAKPFRSNSGFDFPAVTVNVLAF
ncbi:MAG: hypothetical protein ACREJP_04505 [Candidatus Methylomirabilales bacterium]